MVVWLFQVPHLIASLEPRPLLRVLCCIEEFHGGDNGTRNIALVTWCSYSGDHFVVVVLRTLKPGLVDVVRQSGSADRGA